MADDTTDKLSQRERIHRAVLVLRGHRVILDSELALAFGEETKRLNQRVKRNADRFGEKYAFRLTESEFAALRSQIVTSKPGRGGRRYPPWVFTEHGVVMVATVLDSEKAIEASKFIVEVFVEVNRRSQAGGNMALGSACDASLVTDGAWDRVAGLWDGMGPRLQAALNNVLDTVIDHRNQSIVRQEAQDLISRSIQHLKDRLRTSALENEELAAKATKLLAEAEKERSVAAKTRAEAEAIEFQTIIKKLRLLIEAYRAMTENRLDRFLSVLNDLGAVPA